MVQQLSATFNKIFELLKISAEQKEQSGNSNLLHNLSQIAENPNSKEIFSGLFSTFVENSNLLNQFTIQDAATIVEFAAGSKDEQDSANNPFLKKIKELSEKAGDDKRWGKYTDKNEFMKDLGLEKQLAWQNVAAKIKGFTSCPEGKTCSDDPKVIIKDFLESLKNAISDESKKNQIPEFKEEEDLSKDNNKLVQIVNAIEKAIQEKNKQKK